MGQQEARSAGLRGLAPGLTGAGEETGIARRDLAGVGRLGDQQAGVRAKTTTS